MRYRSSWLSNWQCFSRRGLSGPRIRCYSGYLADDSLSHEPNSSPNAPDPASVPSRPKISINSLRELYESRKPIVCLTAHDYPSGLAADQAGVDMILVGDSLAMVALGYENTNQVTLHDILHHCKAVRRGVKKSYLIADLPYGSYEGSQEQAFQSASLLIQQGQVEAVKLEGGLEMADTIAKLVSVGTPVLGHVGLMPQRRAAFGGFKVQGNTANKAAQVLEDALAVEKAGCFAVVLEAVPAEIGGLITSALTIPTIGIGAGNGCSGQVLVQLDMLGAFDRFVPKFTKQYEHIGGRTLKAIQSYSEEVRSGTFPAKSNTYKIPPAELDKFKVLLAGMKLS